MRIVTQDDIKSRAKQLKMDSTGKYKKIVEMFNNLQEDVDRIVFLLGKAEKVGLREREEIFEEILDLADFWNHRHSAQYQKTLDGLNDFTSPTLSGCKTTTKKTARKPVKKTVRRA